MWHRLIIVSLVFAGSLFLSACADYEGGVVMYNEIPESVSTYLEEEKILQDEELLAYYDVTLSLNNSESAMLTTKGVIYHKRGRNTRITYDQIAKVTAEDCFGLCILVESYDSRIMKIEIAPLNGGDMFLDVLMDRSNL